MYVGIMYVVFIEFGHFLHGCEITSTAIVVNYMLTFAAFTTVTSEEREEVLGNEGKNSNDRYTGKGGGGGIC